MTTIYKRRKNRKEIMLHQEKYGTLRIKMCKYKWENDKQPKIK